MVSPPSEPHSEKAHPNSPPQINLAFKAKGPDQDPGTTQPEGNSTHLTLFPRRGARIPGTPPRSTNDIRRDFVLYKEDLRRSITSWGGGQAGGGTYVLA